MLEPLGYASLDELMDAAVPGVIRDTATLDLPAAATEEQAARRAARARRPQHRRSSR